jgi:hypothetical protein
MKYPAIAIATIFILSMSAYAQKGVDPQTQKIKDEGNRVTTRTTDATRSFDWGKGKTKVRPPLANPYRLTGRRDVLIESIVEVLREKRLVIDEAASRISDGFIVTQPFVFAKGAVITSNELNRFAVLDSTTSSWTRAQYSLTIEVQSIDGIQNNVSVTAKVEGRAGSGLMTEWVTVRSSGVAEDDFLAKLVEAVTGVSPDPDNDVN